MISDEKKKRIESLSTDEMLYEINLGHKSRFQREAFAYLKTCYQNQIEKEKSENLISQNQSPNKPSDITNKKHYPRESTIKKVAIGVVTVILGAMAIWGLNHYFHLGL